MQNGKTSLKSQQTLATQDFAPASFLSTHSMKNLQSIGIAGFFSVSINPFLSFRGAQHPQGVRRIRKAAKLPTAAQRRGNPNPRPAASLVKGRWHGEAVTEGFRPPESYPKNGIPQSASLTAPFNKGAKGRGLRIATSGRCPSSQ